MKNMKNQTIEVEGTTITIFQQKEEDYVCLTDMAKTSNDRSEIVIQTWLRNRNTVEFIGLWEQLHNMNFNHSKFAVIKQQVGLNNFYISPSKWVEETQAIGIISKRGRYGGTYAHRDIAMEFGTWLSPRFKLYLVKEFQRLQQERKADLAWDVRRILSKINWYIHTDAVRENQVPVIDWNSKREAIFQASEADLLNLAIFGVTAAQWRVNFPEAKGNMRDHASPEQLVVLANLEAINAELLRDKMDKHQRIRKLHEIASYQLQILTNLPTLKQLPGLKK